MEDFRTFLLVCILVTLLVRWIYIRNRLYAIESRIHLLERAAPVAATPPSPRAVGTPRQESQKPLTDVRGSADSVRDRAATVREPVLPPTPSPQPPAPAQRTSEDWEALLGGNLLNKLGVFVLVIGIALALGYSFTKLGPAGRVATSLAASFAMLISGVVVERRDRYRTFALGLIGGGWAALYFTTYAMQAIPAAKILDNSFAGGVLLLAVAIGMIVHALRYRSQTVAGLAYFIAFVTLAITESTAFSVVALVPLAASLLYIAHRFGWNRFAIFGLLATYITCGARGNTGAPLWQAQSIFAIFWLLFEAFDILCADPWLLPLNALGFLALSSFKWADADPSRIWQFAVGAAAAYLGSAIVRARSGRWKAAVTVNAALGAAAILLKLHDQWVPLAFLIAAELYYLAGVRFQSAWLRNLAAGAFALDLAHLFIVGVATLPARAWEPVAALNVLVFYANRALRPADVFYGYAAAGMAALVSGFEAAEPWRGRVWNLLALAPFGVGWWRRLRDFRIQGYALAALGGMATALYAPHPALALALGAAVSYAFVLSAVWSGPDRFGEREHDAVLDFASFAGNGFLLAALWALLPAAAVGPAWAAVALALIEWDRHISRASLCWQAYIVSGAAFARWCFVPSTVLSGSLVVACYFAALLRRPRGTRPRLYYSLLATSLLAALIYREVTGSVLTVAWGMEGVALLAAGFPLRDRVLRLSGLALLLSCILKLFFWDLRNLDTLPRIFSFIVLGLLLVAVSWVYTRFRDLVQRYL